MADREELLALAERVEKATGPSQPCPECGGSGYSVGPGCCGNYSPHGDCRGDCAVETQYMCGYCGGACFDVLQPHTAELIRQAATAVLGSVPDDMNRMLVADAEESAAMMLVPEGLHWCCQTDRDGAHVSVGKADSDARGTFYTDCRQGTAKSLALALTAAALRARATSVSSPSHTGE